MVETTEENFCLRWNNFAENVSSAFRDLRTESDFLDVTLACSDFSLKTRESKESCKHYTNFVYNLKSHTVSQNEFE